MAEWKRCSEGFSSLGKANHKNWTGKARRLPVTSRGAFIPDFKKSFELAEVEGDAHNEEKISEGIIWSSSDSETGQIEPVLKRRKRSRPMSRGQNKRRSIPAQITPDGSEEIDICESDDEIDRDCIEDQMKQHPAATSGSVQTSDGNIDGYESDPNQTVLQATDIKTPVKNNDTHLQADVEDTSPSITASSSSQSPIKQTGRGRRASDWVKTLELKTPTKTDRDHEENEGIEDSAKKRKKITKGGLADQLSRLQARDKSSARIWSHQHSKQELSQDIETRSVAVRILGLEMLYSLQFTRCEIVSGPGVGSQNLVMFPHRQTEQLKMEIGMILLIAPPWQQLDLSDGRQLLLCTKHCKVLEEGPVGLGLKFSVEDPTCTVPVGREEGGSLTVVKAQWNCPCVLGLCSSSSVCPAFKFPTVPGVLQKMEELHVPGENLGNKGAGLHTVNTKKIAQILVSDSILECIEKSAIEGCGLQSVMCFRALLVNTSRWQEETGKISWKILVEDCHGNMCQVCLSEEEVEACGCRDLEVCEGMTFTFSGLTVGSRIIRERDPGLFSLIDRLWSGTGQTAVSQDSEETTDAGQQTVLVSPPSFCYSLQCDAQNQDGFQLKPSPSPITNLSENLHSKRLTQTQLADVEQMDQTVVIRHNLLVRLIHVYRESGVIDDKAVQCVLYITDKSLPGKYLKLHVQKSCDFRLPSLNKHEKSIVHLMACCYNQGGLYMDGYSRLNRTTSQHQELLDELRRLTVHLPVASEIISPLSLCQVSGQIIEVDENSAYSWDACPYCDSDNLVPSGTAGDGGPVKCQGCGRSGVTSVTRMRMEIVVNCPSLKNCTVKIDLLQRTIESLLPESEQPEDGYELSSVLNKPVGPLSCFVISSHVRKERQEYFLQEINT